MKIAAAYAIAESIDASVLGVDNILPKAFDLNVGKNVARAVSKAAIESGVSKLENLD